MSLAQVVLAFRCGGSRVAYACRLPLRRPLTQSKTPRRPRVRACCWFALLFLVPPMVAFACWCRTSRCRRQLWRTRLQPKPQTDVFGKCGGKSTGKHPCTRQDLAAAKRQRDVALSGLEGRRPDRIPAEAAAGVGRQQQRKGQGGQAGAQGGQEGAQGGQEGAQGGRAEVRGQSKRPGRTRAGRGFCMCSCCCCLWFAAFPHGRRAFSCGPPLLLFGVMLSSQQGFRSSLSCFHCVGLQHVGEWPILCSLCARSPGCGCFCLRLDFQATVSVRGGQGSQPCVLSACL